MEFNAWSGGLQPKIIKPNHLNLLTEFTEKTLSNPSWKDDNVRFTTRVSSERKLSRKNATIFYRFILRKLFLHFSRANEMRKNGNPIHNSTLDTIFWSKTWKKWSFFVRFTSVQLWLFLCVFLEYISNQYSYVFSWIISVISIPMCFPGVYQ